MIPMAPKAPLEDAPKHGWSKTKVHTQVSPEALLQCPSLEHQVLQQLWLLLVK